MATKNKVSVRRKTDKRTSKSQRTDMAMPSKIPAQTSGLGIDIKAKEGIMDDMQNGYYTRKHLLQELRKRKLPASYPTLLKYERAKILPEPRRITFSDRQWRVYTEDDVKKIIDAIKKHHTAR